MGQCKFKVGDVLTMPYWSGLAGDKEFEVSKVEDGLFWFKGYEDQCGREADGYILVRRNKTPHKHAELIKKWADDPSIEIEYFDSDYCQWLGTFKPSWNEEFEYRIKPEPKPDIVIDYNSFEPLYLERIEKGSSRPKNVRFTYDGETNKLKSVEMI